jgi:hypothetical protein
LLAASPRHRVSLLPHPLRIIIIKGETLQYVIAASLILSVSLLTMAILTSKVWLSIAALVFSIPVSVLLMGYPSLFYIPAIFPLLIFLGGKKLESNNKKTAVIFFSPYLLIAIPIILFGYVLDFL